MANRIHDSNPMIGGASRNSQVIPQYAYPFPNVMKASPRHMTQSLSVVSAPAPVVQRPELSSAGSNSRLGAGGLTNQPSLDNISGLRSTKSQRVRGASNNMRLKQLELRENAVVLS